MISERYIITMRHEELDTRFTERRWDAEPSRLKGYKSVANIAAARIRKDLANGNKPEHFTVWDMNYQAVELSHVGVRHFAEDSQPEWIYIARAMQNALDGK